MRTFAPLAVLLALLPAPVLAATRTFSVTGFEKIRVEGPYAVTLRVGPPGSAIATGDQRAIDRLDIQVQGRTLVIRTDRTSTGWDRIPPGRVTLAVATPMLTAATLAGSGSLAIDRAKAQRFDLAVSGSGSASLGALQADRAVLALVGTGTLTIAGAASQTSAALQGSGSIDAAKLAVDDLDLAASGSGGATFTARRRAKVTAAGSGDVTVTGAAACTVTRAGSGEVRCGRN